MPFGSDFALLGTGIAPLLVASHLIAEGKSVLLLNPDQDYFLEDSELGLDPMLPLSGTLQDKSRLARLLFEAQNEILGPEYPGNFEVWPAPNSSGFHDPLAPCLRTRSRLWVERTDSPKWRELEDLYVLAADSGLKPQFLEGVAVMSRFPGASPSVRRESHRGVLIPRCGEVDVARYRRGVLSFLIEKISEEQRVGSISQLQLVNEGVRFHQGGAPRTAKIKEGLLVFWTPRLNSWILSQRLRRGATIQTQANMPTGMRNWEQWTLVSRDSLDPGMVGNSGGFSLWAEIEGFPDSRMNERLSVLRPGSFLSIEQGRGESVGPAAESLTTLPTLCTETLGWEKFSIRGMRGKTLMDWPVNLRGAFPWELEATTDFSVSMVSRSDGPLVDIVQNAKTVSRQILSQKREST